MKVTVFILIISIGLLGCNNQPKQMNTSILNDVENQSELNENLNFYTEKDTVLIKTELGDILKFSKSEFNRITNDHSELFKEYPNHPDQAYFNDNDKEDFNSEIGQDVYKRQDDTPPLDSVITGQWKLVSARIVNFISNPTIDYSDQNIVYDFQADGTLIVTGDNVGHSNGTYSYILGLDYLHNSSLPGYEMIPLVKINSTQKWIYQRADRIMVLKTSYIDGPDLTFERN